MSSIVNGKEENDDYQSHHHLNCSEKIILILISLFTLILSSIILLHISQSKDELHQPTHHDGSNNLPTIIQSILMESFFRIANSLSEILSYLINGEELYMKICSRELRFDKRTTDSPHHEGTTIHIEDENTHFIMFPKEISYNYDNVNRVTGQKGSNGPKIRNGHHCPYLGFRKHSHYQLSQTLLSTVCYQNIEFSQYCNVEIVKQDFHRKLSPQSLKGFNRDSRVRNHQFAQCCDLTGFQFNFKQRIEELIQKPALTIEQLETIVPKSVLQQLHSVLTMNDLISYSSMATSVDWNALHIFDFFHSERFKKQVLRSMPEILYSESKVLAALKFGLWSYQFTKYGTCVTNQIYERHVDAAFEQFGGDDDGLGEVIDRRVQSEKVWRSDPELYFQIMFLLHKRFDYFGKKQQTKQQQFLEHFPPSLTRAVKVSEVKARIYEWFGDRVLMSCAVSQNYTYPLVYQFHTCMAVEDVEPLANYLMERNERFRRGDQLVKSQPLTKDVRIMSLLEKIKSESCLSMPNFNRTQFNQHYFNNFTDMTSHFKYADDPNIQITNECHDEELVLIPDTAELLKKFRENEEEKIVEVPVGDQNSDVFDFGFLAGDHLDEKQEPDGDHLDSSLQQHQQQDLTGNPENSTN